MEWEAYTVTCPLYCKVIIVPVTPIKRSRYAHFAARVKECIFPRARVVDSGGGGGGGGLDQLQRHSFLEEFQPWRRTFAVVGVMDSREWIDVVDAQRTFRRLLKKRTGILDSTLLAFNTYGHERAEAGFVPIPEGETAEKEVVSYALQELWSSIQRGLADLLVAAESRETFDTPIDFASAQRAVSPFPIDADHVDKRPEPVSSPASFNSKKEDPAETKARMRKLGRRAKCCGDIHLLLGRSDIAMSCYQEAVDKLRTWSDFIWLGSALEGRALARLVSSAHTSDDVSRTSLPGILMDTANEFAEALAMYAKASHLPASVTAPTPALVYVTAALRCCDLLLKVWSKRPIEFPSCEPLRVPDQLFTPAQISRSILRAYGEFLDHCSLVDHFTIVSIIVEHFQSLGMKRRAVFFQNELMHIAKMLLSSDAEELAPPVSPDMSREDRQLGMEPSKATLTWTAQLLPRYNDLLVQLGCLEAAPLGTHGGGWYEVKAQVLRKVAHEVNADFQSHVDECIEMLAILLGRYHAYLDQRLQQAISAILSTKRASMSRSIQVPLQGIVLGIERCRLDSCPMPMLTKAPRKLSLGNADTQWKLVKPKSLKPTKDVELKTMIANETAVFKIRLANPLQIPLTLTKISLMIEPKDAATIPPLDKYMHPQSESLVLVTVTPTRPGPLRILGMTYVFLGLQGTHLWSLPTTFDADEHFRLKSLAPLETASREEKTLPAHELTTDSLATAYSVEVLKEMPLLQIDGGTLQEGRLMLFEGETSLQDIIVTNVGYCGARIQSIGSAKDAKVASGADQILTCDISDLALAAQDSTKLKLHCNPTTQATSTFLHIQYRSDDDEVDPGMPEDLSWVRHLVLRLQLTIYHVLEADITQIVRLCKNQCLVLFDVKNVYGTFFEVSLRHQTTNESNTTIVIPGSTIRLGLKIDRLGTQEMKDWQSSLRKVLTLGWREPSQKRSGNLPYRCTEALQWQNLSRPELDLSIALEEGATRRVEETIQGVCHMTNTTDSPVDILVHMKCGVPAVDFTEQAGALDSLDSSSVLLSGSPVKRFHLPPKKEAVPFVFSAIFLSTGRFSMKVFARAVSERENKCLHDPCEMQIDIVL